MMLVKTYVLDILGGQILKLKQILSLFDIESNFTNYLTGKVLFVFLLSDNNKPDIARVLGRVVPGVTL